MSAKAIILDKDGTLIQDVPYNVDPAHIRLMPGAAAGLRRLARAGYKLFVVTNQSGVARGLFREEALLPVKDRLHQLLSKEGVCLQGFYYCPHHPEGQAPRYAIACECRKPQPGLVLRAAREHALDLADSWTIGDILDDIEAGRRAGCKTILINNGHETEWVISPLREPDYVAGDLEKAADIILGGHADR
jgi:D-glycero-D-manno-heptose 1,7-bisphosphate phosphatase